MTMPPALVLARHGQSEWNRQNRFAGWEDPPLTDKGRDEARQTAARLAAAGAVFDAAHTSYLRRAIETLHLIQERMSLMWIPSATDWRLNERHYGGLQGENKSDMAKLHGEEKLRLWRRGCDIPPPPGGGAAAPDHRYDGVAIPNGESLTQTAARVWAYYEENILPQLRAKKRVLVVAHGNSLRGLIMRLENLSPPEVMALEIPTAAAAAYQADPQGRPLPPHRFI